MNPYNLISGIKKLGIVVTDMPQPECALEDYRNALYLWAELPLSTALTLKTQAFVTIDRLMEDYYYENDPGGSLEDSVVCSCCNRMASVRSLDDKYYVICQCGLYTPSFTSIELAKAMFHKTLSDIEEMEQYRSLFDK